LCWILSVFIRSYAFLILFFANISVISVPSVADVFDCGYAALCPLCFLILSPLFNKIPPLLRKKE